MGCKMDIEDYATAALDTSPTCCEQYVYGKRGIEDDDLEVYLNFVHLVLTEEYPRLIEILEIEPSINSRFLMTNDPSLCIIFENDGVHYSLRTVHCSNETFYMIKAKKMYKNLIPLIDYRSISGITVDMIYTRLDSIFEKRNAE